MIVAWAFTRERDALDQIWIAYREWPQPRFELLAGRNMGVLSIGEQSRRVSCIRIEASSHVELVSLGLRDCWLPAVLTLGSQNIALRDSVIQGSSYVLAAFPARSAPLRPETAHSFEVTGNYWEQSPALFRPTQRSCDDRNDWDCPVSIWSDLPWGVTHSYFWEPLNGALFGSRNILGNVKFTDNVVIDAYNGLRMTVNDDCLADPVCASRTNVGVEIAGNTFINIRDNPVEPEGHALQLETCSTSTTSLGSDARL
jgi:hypothetical protein